MILASTSTIYGSTYLDYIKDEVKLLFSNSKKIIFIPYARPNGLTYEEYTEIASSFFITLGIKVNGIHEYKDLKKAITENDGIFIGGGNSFLLLKTLIDNDLITPSSVLSDRTIKEFSDSYMYLSCVEHVKKVKTGGSFENHSPTLASISVVPNWRKVAQGLVKMYYDEFFKKYVIMQHFYFGSVIRFE